jgi:hypothetical protein
MFETPSKIENQAEAERETELSYEGEMKKRQAMFNNEADFFDETKESIFQNPKNKRKRMFARLNTYFFAGLMAFGIASETLTSKALAEGMAEKKPANREKIDLEKLEQERRKAYEEFKNIIEKEDIQKKVDELKKEYGEGLEYFFFLTEIRRSLMAYEKIDPVDSESFIFKENPFAVTLGSFLEKTAKEHWRPLTEQEKNEKIGAVEIKGFEQFEGMTNEAVQGHLAENFPKTWLASVKQIIYKPYYDYLFVDEKLGARVGSARRFGNQDKDIEGEDPRSIIKIHKGARRNAEGIFVTIDHELAHLNDWESSVTFSGQERINFLWDVMQVLKKHHFETSYVKGIGNDNGMHRYRKAGEYWAELVSIYKNLDEEKRITFEESYPEDAKLLKKWMK